MSGDSGCCSMIGVEHRYHNIRAQLDELGFRQPLAIECLPLVEALFRDLIRTTSSLEHYKKQAQTLEEQVRVLNRGVQPFRNDNERLVRQITELNQQITHIKEEADGSVTDFKARCRKLEHENADLQFLVNQHLARIRTLEVESAEKSKKLLNLQAAPSITNGKKKNTLNQKTKVEILSSVGPPKKQPPGRPWLDVFSGALTQTEDPFVVNMVDRSQAELRACRYEMKLLREESEKLNETVSSLRQQVRDRDLEIAKLTTQLESSRSHASSGDPEIVRNDYAVANLRASILSLEDSNQKLRLQLQDALRKQHEAMIRAVRLAERNQVLQSEIRNVDNVAMKVEDSCNFTVKETSQKIIQLQEQLTQYQKIVSELERNGVEARNNAQNLLMDIEKLRLENRQLLEIQRHSSAQNHPQVDQAELMKHKHVEEELTKEIEGLLEAVTYQKQKIAELEEKVALSTPVSAKTGGTSAVGCGASGNGNGSATSKRSSSSGSGRSAQNMKKPVASKKAGNHTASSNQPKSDNGNNMVRCSNRSTAIQTESKGVDSKEIQVNLRDPPEREKDGFVSKSDRDRRSFKHSDQQDNCDYLDKYRNQDSESVSNRRNINGGGRPNKNEFRKERRKEHLRSKKDEEEEEFTYDRFSEQEHDKLSREQRREQERESKIKGRSEKFDDLVSERSDPIAKTDRSIQCEAAHNGNSSHCHHHYACVEGGAGDGPWNVKSPPDLCPIVKTLEAERNFFEKEYHRIREYLDNMPDKPGCSDLLWKLRDAKAELDAVRTENHRLSAEVAELSAIYRCEAADSRSHSDANRALVEKYTEVKQRLIEKEGELLTVCEENHSLLSEKDALSHLLQRGNQDCDRLSNELHSLQVELDILRAKKSADLEKDRFLEENRSLRAEIDFLRGRKSADATLENERERDRNRLIEENKQLRENIESLKTNTMFSSSDKMCYDKPQSVMDVVDALHKAQERVWELEADGRNAVRTLDKEVLELRSQLAACNKQLDDATLQAEAAQTRLAELQNSLGHSNAKFMKVKVLLEETQRSLEQTQNDLSRLQSASVHQEEHIQKLEFNRNALEKEANALRSEVQRLHSAINELENEKDELIRAADQRAEQVQMLSEDVRERDSRLKQLENAIQDLRYASERDQKLRADLEESLRAMTRDYDEASAARNALASANEGAARENKRLQEELAGMTSSLRATTESYEESCREVDNLKRQLQIYVLEVQRFEQLLGDKESERNEMLETFRNLSDEASKLDSHNMTLETDYNTMRGSIDQYREQIHALNHQLADKDAVIQSYEKQIEQLSASMAHLEGQLEESRITQESLERDLQSAQGLARQLESQKEALQDMLDDLQQQKDLAERQTLDVNEQQALLQRQQQELQATIQSMENLLAESRSQVSKEATRAAELEQDNRTMTAQIESLQRTIDQLTARADKAEELLERNRESVAEYERRLQHSNSEIERQTHNQSALTTATHEKEQEIRQLRLENNNLAKTLEETRVEVQRCKETIESLKERMAELEGSERSSRRQVADARREAAESMRYLEDSQRKYESKTSQDKRLQEVESRRTRDVEPDAYHYKTPETPRSFTPCSCEPSSEEQPKRSLVSATCSCGPVASGKNKGALSSSPCSCGTPSTAEKTPSAQSNAKMHACCRPSSLSANVQSTDSQFLRGRAAEQTGDVTAHIRNTRVHAYDPRVADAAFPQDIECTYTPSGQHIESCTAKYIFGTHRTPGPAASAPLEARVISPQDHESLATSAQIKTENPQIAFHMVQSSVKEHPRLQAAPIDTPCSTTAYPHDIQGKLSPSGHHLHSCIARYVFVGPESNAMGNQGGNAPGTYVVLPLLRATPAGTQGAGKTVSAARVHIQLQPPNLRRAQKFKE